MPYSSTKDVPDYVPAAKRKQWLRVFNSAYASAVKDGKSAKDAEAHAFAEANGVAGPNADKILASYLLLKFGTAATGFVSGIHGPFRCGRCDFYKADEGFCEQPEVRADPDSPKDSDGNVVVSFADCCNEWEPAEEAAQKAMKGTFQKFVQFVKVDNSIDPTTNQPRREVWGIVTAEVPDKDDEVCDYDGSKPFYQAVIAEMSKATDGKNLFPLREMHGLTAAGKCVGFEFRDDAKEIFMGFKVVDDEAWKKVDEGVYTGFSQGGRIVGDLTPDPVFKGCMRYVANPSEISLVDNPCLGTAHFTYVKTDGRIELRKLRSIEPALAKAKTKRVGGKDLTSASFAYVGDPERTETWKLPIHDAAHVRNALARFSQTKGIPADKKDAVHARIVSAAKKFGIEVSSEKSVGGRLNPDSYAYVPDVTQPAGWRLRVDDAAYVRKSLFDFNRVAIPTLARPAVYAKIAEKARDFGIDIKFEEQRIRSIVHVVRKRARTWVNKRFTRLSKSSFINLDSELGKLQKGMYQVSATASALEQLAYVFYSVVCEQEWEHDEDSPLPEMLQENLNDLIDTMLALTAEEAEEMKEEIAGRVAGVKAAEATAVSSIRLI